MPSGADAGPSLDLYQVQPSGADVVSVLPILPPHSADMPSKSISPYTLCSLYPSQDICDVWWTV